MAPPLHSSDDVSMPALLRHARFTYAAAMRSALIKAAYDDLPQNGLYVIGGLASQARARPLSSLIEELRLSKQAAGQLVDTLVTRGYLKRHVDLEDRRRLTIELTPKGRAAAKVLASARLRVDEEWVGKIGRDQLQTARIALLALIEMGQQMVAGDEG